MNAWYLKLTTDARKFGVAILGGAGTILATGLVPAPERTWITALVAVLTALGVGVVPNVPTGPVD